MSWVRVSKDNPCLVCGKPDWCLNADDKDAACCQRISEGSKKQLGDAGWLHIFNPGKKHHYPRRITLNTSPAPLPDMSKFARACAAHITVDQLARLANRLGVSVESLRRLGVGTVNGRKFTFPMSNAEGRIIGIRTRTEKDKYGCQTGSKTGLFIPKGLTNKGPLLVAEGPTDCAAGLDLGFDCIGRPNCNSLVAMTCSLCTGRKEVVVVADNDPKSDGTIPGIMGAHRLHDSLMLYCPCVKLIIPPTPVKDLRQWLREGLTHKELKSIIDKTGGDIGGALCLR